MNGNFDSSPACDFVLTRLAVRSDLLPHGEF